MSSLRLKAAIGEDDDDWHWEEELKRSPEWREFLIAEVAGRPIGFMHRVYQLRREVWQQRKGMR